MIERVNVGIPREKRARYRKNIRERKARERGTRETKVKDHRARRRARHDKREKNSQKCVGEESTSTNFK